MVPNYYEVLSIPIESSTDQIRQAFRALAKQYHPDLNKQADAATMFRQIFAAYEILSDHQRRAVYDQVFTASRKHEASQPEKEKPIDEWKRRAYQDAEHYANNPLEELMNSALWGVKVVAKGISIGWMIFCGAIVCMLIVAAIVEAPGEAANGIRRGGYEGFGTAIVSLGVLAVIGYGAYRAWQTHIAKR